MAQYEWPFKYVNIPHIVITKIEMINIQTGAKAVHIGSGGVEGIDSVQIAIKGNEEQVEKAIDIINSIKV